MRDDKNADDLFGEPECNPLDKPYYPVAKYTRPKRPKQQVYAYDGSDQSISTLNALLDKNWRLVQQLESLTGDPSRNARSLYLLELEGE